MKIIIFAILIILGVAYGIAYYRMCKKSGDEYKASRSKRSS